MSNPGRELPPRKRVRTEKGLEFDEMKNRRASPKDGEKAAKTAKVDTKGKSKVSRKIVFEDDGKR